MDDEVDGDEIVIRGAIKKSSLKGVHEYLNSEDDEILEKDDESDNQRSKPRKSSI